MSDPFYCRRGVVDEDKKSDYSGLVDERRGE